MFHKSRKGISRHLKPGLCPGKKVNGEAGISVIRYSGETFEEEVLPVSGLPPVSKGGGVLWVDIPGLHDRDLLERAGKEYGIHHLVLEDICDTGQRAKTEDYDDFQYIVIKMLSWDEASKGIDVEQVSFVLFENTLISFQEHPGDLFGGVRERLRLGKGRIRRQGADYLTYALLDAIVDGYFLLTEKIGDQVELIENELIANPRTATAGRIHELKREMIFLRKAVWPLREVISMLDKSERFFSGETAVYMRDLYDHVIQIIDAVETIRDVLSGMLDIYLSSVSNRMNEIMKVLTIIATIFIPLTFIAGVYGMNFRYMPELGWKWGYGGALGVMAATAWGMLRFFRKKGWL
ncbi:MAG: magnesium/cobalt transporter CorA [Dehalobacter sp. 4CP]|nr:magnesium/cobalt transporter CorA [Dehalobacter sp. 4CP]